MGIRDVRTKFTIRHMYRVFEWLSTWCWVFLFILGLIGIMTYAISYENVLFNLSICLFTSAIFYFFVTFLPASLMRKQEEKIIHINFLKQQESLRQCKISIYSPFDLSTKPNEKNEEDYIRDFEQTDFSKCWMLQKTHYQKFEEERNKAKNIAEYLQSQRSLSLKQQRIISEILSSIFANEELRPILYDLNETVRSSYPNNQKKMGECIYRLYNLLLT